MNKKFLFLVFVSLFLLFSLNFVSSQESQLVCGVYFTGVGCPHCAAADPVILEDYTGEYSNFVVIEYEIYQLSENGKIFQDYISNANAQSGVPQILIGEGLEAGESNSGGPTTTWTRQKLETMDYSTCKLSNDSSVAFEDLNLKELPGKPKIWRGERILIKEKEEKTENGTEITWRFQWNDNYKVQKNGFNNSFLKELLFGDIDLLLSEIDFSEVDSEKVPLSGSNVEFDNAIEFKTTRNGVEAKSEELTLAKLISLAAVDAVNPCALAVLTLMLIAILTYNPKKRKNLLWAGLAFACSVFIMYLIYGLIIIKFFQLIQALTSIRLILYKVLGGLAILLGVLNIRDFFVYTPGTLGTEMPLKLRPKMKKMIEKVTSPKGAFVIGLFVTIFLLPCTIGPYVIAGGILSASELIATIPPLLLYNFIFVLPMIILSFCVYKGFAKVQDISGWKDRNIKKLHLFAGIVMLLLGIAMVVGLV